METYKVVWAHLGDRAYKEGDERIAHPATVAHLVKNGTLVLKSKVAKAKAATKTKAKAMPKTKNKAEGAAPVNKTVKVTKPKKRGLGGIFKTKG